MEGQNSELNLNFAKLDLSRKSRTGYPETIFCPNKSTPELVSIFSRLYEINGEVLATRCNDEQALSITNAQPKAIYDKRSQVIYISKDKPRVGNIVICSAGTADIAVAEEAALTAEFFGNNVTRIYDVGVSGLHRLLSRLDVVRTGNVVIAVAGMEAALASVLGGLVSVPIIAVPTSVGYGANFGGLSALLGMLNSCGNGISVVNIDNGYGAGYIASQINKLAVGVTDGK